LINTNKLNFSNFAVAPFAAALLEWTIARFDRRLAIADLPMAQTPRFMDIIKRAHIVFIENVMRELVAELDARHTEENTGTGSYLSCEIAAPELYLPAPYRGFGFATMYSDSPSPDAFVLDKVHDSTHDAAAALAFECADLKELALVAAENPILYTEERVALRVRLWRASTTKMLTVRDVNLSHVAFGNRREHLTTELRREFMYDESLGKFMPGRSQTLTSTELKVIIANKEESARKAALLQVFGIDQVHTDQLEIEGAVTVRVSEAAAHEAAAELENDTTTWDPATLYETVDCSSAYGAWRAARWPTDTYAEAMLP